MPQAGSRRRRRRDSPRRRCGRAAGGAGGSAPPSPPSSSCRSSPRSARCPTAGARRAGRSRPGRSSTAACPAASYRRRCLQGARRAPTSARCEELESGSEHAHEPSVSRFPRTRELLCVPPKRVTATRTRSTLGLARLLRNCGPRLRGEKGEMKVRTNCGTETGQAPFGAVHAVAIPAAAHFGARADAVQAQRSSARHSPR